MKLINYINKALPGNAFYEPSEEDNKRMKECLLSIYKDIDTVCKKNNLLCMLAGGSALGAIRHHGFIPWDDDIDLLMPRKEYNIFISIFEEAMGEDYYIIGPYSKRSNYFVQVVKKSTVVRYVNSIEDSGIHIDIFPIDNVPNNVIARYFKHYLAIIFRGILFSVKAFRAKDSDFKRLMHNKIGTIIIYWIVNLVGLLFTVAPIRIWSNLCDRIISSRKSSKYSTVAVGRKLYLGEMLETKSFVPPHQAEFEGLNVLIPRDYDRYLQNLYGDYMTLPPIEKRETHSYSKLIIN